MAKWKKCKLRKENKIFKNKFRTEDAAQVVDHLAGMCKVLGLLPSTTKQININLIRNVENFKTPLKSHK